MTFDTFLLAAALLGHLALLVLAVNVAHSFGLHTTWMERSTLAIAAVLGPLTIVAAWGLAGEAWARWPLGLRIYAVPCLAVALVGLPATTLSLRFRRAPRGISGRSVAVDLDFGGAPPVGSGRFAWLLRLPGNEALRLHRSDWRVEVEGLPAALDGLSIAHMTDFHFSRAYDRRYFEAVADEAARGEPDLVLFTGDLIDDDAAIDWIVPVLSRVRGRLGQFAILGNHDRDHHPDRVAAELERAGFAVLEGRWTTLDVGGATLALGGTSSPWGPPLDLAARPEADLSVFLCHTPDLFPTAAASGIDLMFSGHNHAGQVRLPVVGPVLMPSRYSRRYDRGFFRRGKTLLYVGPGVGGKHPVRYGCPPEVARFELRASAPDADRRAGPASSLVLGAQSVVRPAADLRPISRTASSGHVSRGL